MFQSEVEETLKRIQSQKGVQGIIIVNSEGEAALNNLHKRVYFCSFSLCVCVSLLFTRHNIPDLILMMDTINQRKSVSTVAERV